MTQFIKKAIKSKLAIAVRFFFQYSTNPSWSAVQQWVQSCAGAVMLPLNYRALRTATAEAETVSATFSDAQACKGPSRMP